MVGRKLQITVPIPIFDALEKQSKEQGISKSTLILMCLNQHFNDIEKRAKTKARTNKTKDTKK